MALHNARIVSSFVTTVHCTILYTYCIPAILFCSLTNSRDSSEGVEEALGVPSSEALRGASRRSLSHHNVETSQLRLPRPTISCSVFQNSAAPSHGAVGDALSSPPAQNSSTATFDPPLQIEYSPCPVRTTKSLLALRRRLTDVFVQPYRSVGTLRPPAQRSHDNPIYFALPQDESSHHEVSDRREIESKLMSCDVAKSPNGQNVDDVPFKFRRKDPSLCFVVQQDGSDKTGVMGQSAGRPFSEDRNNFSPSYSNKVTLSSLSRNMASLRLSNCPTDATALQHFSRISPPSPFLNCTTFIANALSTSQHQPVQALGHDVTDPRFLSSCSVLESADVPFSSSTSDAVGSSAEVLRNRNQASPRTPTAQGTVSRVLRYPEESPVKKSDSSQEQKYVSNKRRSLRRVRTATSNTEGPPVKVQPVVSSGGQLIFPTHDTSRSLSSPNTRVVRRSSDISRPRKTSRRCSKQLIGGDEPAMLMGLGDAVLASDSVVCDSDFSNEASPCFEVYPDNREEGFMLKRQGGFRRRQRTVFRTTTTSDSCLLKLPDRRTNKLSGLTLPNGIPSPLSPRDAKAWLPDLSSFSNMSCHIVGLPRTDSVQSSSHPAVRERSLSVVGRLNSAVSCFSMPSRFGLTLSKGIPSPPSPTNDNDQCSSSFGIAGIQPLSSSPVPPAEGRSEFTSKQKEGASEEQGTSSSDDTWNSHKQHLTKTPLLAAGHAEHVKNASIGKSTERIEDTWLKGVWVSVRNESGRFCCWGCWVVTSSGMCVDWCLATFRRNPPARGKSLVVGGSCAVRGILTVPHSRSWVAAISGQKLNAVHGV